MVPSAYNAYFGGCASVAGTLIGLLFVAISVSPHKHAGLQAPLSFRVQAGVAFTTLIDALAVALAALLPGSNLATASGESRPAPESARRPGWPCEPPGTGPGAVTWSA